MSAAEPHGAIIAPPALRLVTRINGRPVSQAEWQRILQASRENGVVPLAAPPPAQSR